MVKAHQIWKLVGALSFLPHLLAVVEATLRRPDYNHATQYLSELGEHGSATEVLMNFGGIIPTGAMISVFGIGLAVQFRRDPMIVVGGLLIALHGALRISAGLFPCDQGCVPDVPSFRQQVHNLSATIGYVSLTTAAFIIGAAMIVRRAGAMFAILTYAAAIAASVALVMLVFHAHGHAGLYQRIALFTLQAWLTALAAFVLPNGGSTIKTTAASSMNA